MSNSSFDARIFGQNLREMRKFRKIPVSKLAQSIDVGERHINNLETGNSNPSVNALVGLANTLKVSADDLLCGCIDYRASANTALMEIFDDLSDEDLDFIIEITKVIKNYIHLKEYNSRIKEETK